MAKAHIMYWFGIVLLWSTPLQNWNDLLKHQNIQQKLSGHELTRTKHISWLVERCNYNLLLFLHYDNNFYLTIHEQTKLVDNAVSIEKCRLVCGWIPGCIDGKK